MEFRLFFKPSSSTIHNLDYKRLAVGNINTSSAWSFCMVCLYLIHLCVVFFSVYIVWNGGRVIIFYNYHVVIIMGLISRLRAGFLLGVTGSWVILMDLANVKLHVRPVGTHVKFL